MRVAGTMYGFGALFGCLVVWAQFYCINYHQYHFNYDLLLFAFLGAIMLLLVMMTLWFKW